ncbi:unnamed protein product [Mytilus coruscus]|uniref:Integrase catalytic domain-containing protein n=1 Tax=Mytilus coruscus TaxID=42192 RepID=A0A6J8ARJ2_MYTCO|nr:unnamed protein product [Mytilus coruscus]
MLDKIHESHLGIVKCKSRARDVLFWIGMGQDIEDKAKSCGLCAQRQSLNAKEPMLMPEIQERPWTNVKIWIYIDELVSDNGPQFPSLEFKRFATEYRFKHTTSRPHYAQSNGQAERSVQTVKKLIMKSKDLHKALLDYRNTPLDIDLSPAQLFLNRRLKTSLPTSLPLLMPQNINNREILKKLEIRQRKTKTNYDKHCGPELKHLKQGDSVVMYTDGKWKAVKIMQKTPHSSLLCSTNVRWQTLQKKP